MVQVNLFKVQSQVALARIYDNEVQSAITTRLLKKKHQCHKNINAVVRTFLNDYFVSPSNFGKFILPKVSKQYAIQRSLLDQRMEQDQVWILK